MTDREVLRNTSLESLLRQVRKEINLWAGAAKYSGQTHWRDAMLRTIEAIDTKLEMEAEREATRNA